MSNWTKNTLESRVEKESTRSRYEGGSPNALELEHYKSCLPDEADVGVVLGMTPELRNLAATRCRRLISIDANAMAIDLYRDWLSPEHRKAEEIVRGNWLELGELTPQPPGFILGDGIFGNIIPFPLYRTLLAAIRDRLAPGGVFITRQCLMPGDCASRRDELLGQFRCGKINAAEFGFSMRILGYADSAYDRTRFSLDNADVFSRIEKDHQRGILTAAEYQITRRYHFDGENIIPSQYAWEGALTESGFTFSRSALSGRNWYPWYLIYHCRKAS